MGNLLGKDALDAAGQTIVLKFAALLMLVLPSWLLFECSNVARINGDERKGWLEQLHAKRVSGPNFW